ncbi:MAG: calcium/sodium antiporter, partial [Bacillota bacterium]
MAEFLYFFFFSVGLLMVIKGSDWFVTSSIWTAEVFRIPSIMIGATIVSICTTIPETFVSATAAFKGEPVMAIGNALGSSAVNAGFILGILLIFTKPFIENRREFLQNGFFMVFLILLVWMIGIIFGQISRIMGVGLIILFLAYIIKNIFSARKLMDLDISYEIEDEEHIMNHIDPDRTLPDGIVYDESENDFDISFQTLAQKILFFILGVAMVLLGSDLLVVYGIRIANLLHVPTILIAVIFTSGGTSLPELVTVITSIRKGVSNLGIGNLIGANILNIVQVIGFTALLHPLDLTNEKSILTFQLPMLFIMSLSVFFFSLFNKG